MAEFNDTDEYKNGKCMYYLGLFRHNPFLSWLGQKALLLMVQENQTESLGRQSDVTDLKIFPFSKL